MEGPATDDFEEAIWPTRANEGDQVILRAQSAPHSDRLAELSQQHGFEVLAFATNDYLDTVEMMEASEQRGFQRLHLQANLERHFEESMGRPFEWGRYKDSDLVVSPGNLHPSVLQHAMAAETLLAHLEQTGLLEGWTAVR